MSNYSQTTFFTPKDSLPPSNPAKTIFGAAYDIEFGNISTAIASKYDSSSIAAGQVAFGLGSSTLPSITFLGQTGTGWSSNGSGDLIGSTAGLTAITISGTNQGIFLPAATGSSQGSGTLNATGLFINGVAVIAGSGAGGVSSITGTANQIVASAATGAVTLSLSKNVIIPTPVSGIALVATAVGANVIVQFNASSGNPGVTQTLAGSTQGAYFEATANGVANLLFGFNGTAGADGNGFAAGHGGIGTPNGVALDITTSGIQRIQIGNTGAIIINAPTSGIALAVNAVAGNLGLTVQGASGQIAMQSTTLGVGTAYQASGPAATQLTALNMSQSGQTSWAFYQPGSSNDLRFFAGADRVIFGAGGNVSINTPTSGAALTATGATSANAIVATQNGVVGGAGAIVINSVGSVTTTGSGQFSFDTNGNMYLTNSIATVLTIGGFTAGSSINFVAGGGTRLVVGTAGNVTINAPTSGVGLTVTGVSGTHSTKITDSAANSFNAGFLEIPQNSQSAAYQLVLADSGKHIYHPSADTTARTWTIPANGTVAFPIGTAVTFDNDTSAGVITLAITTDTLVFLPSGSTGSRSIAANGQGTILKVTATRWHLTGVGIT